MADLVLAGAGAAIGFFVGGPMGALYGAQIGFTAGSMIGASGQTIQGPKIGEVATQNSKEGVPRPIVFGVARPIGGNIMALGKPIIVTVEEDAGGGKGGDGPTVEREEVYRTYAIRICEGPVSGVRRVWRDNKLVYDSLAGDALEYLQNEGGIVQGTYTVNVVDPAYTGPTTYEYQYDGKGPPKTYHVGDVANAAGGEAGRAFDYFNSQGAYIQEQRDGDLEIDGSYSGGRIYGYTAESALTQVENNVEFLKTATFYLGSYDQMPDPALETEFGVANVTAYRGTCYMVMDNEDLTPRRGSVPNYVFEVARGEGFPLTSRPYPAEILDNYTDLTHTVTLVDVEQVIFPPPPPVEMSAYGGDLAFTPALQSINVKGPIEIGETSSVSPILAEVKFPYLGYATEGVDPTPSVISAKLSLGFKTKDNTVDITPSIQEVLIE